MQKLFLFVCVCVWCVCVCVGGGGGAISQPGLFFFVGGGGCGRVISMHFRGFPKVKVQSGNIFGGCLISFKYFLRYA